MSLTLTLPVLGFVVIINEYVKYECTVNANISSAMVVFLCNHLLNRILVFLERSSM